MDGRAAVLVGHAGNSVTDMSFPPSSEQGRKATRIGYTGSFSNAGLAAVGTSVLTNYLRGPRVPAMTPTLPFRQSRFYASPSFIGIGIQ
ncbi:MAG: hypothetical protein AB8B97_06365 [Granulosicoccus sp.]